MSRDAPSPTRCDRLCQTCINKQQRSSIPLPRERSQNNRTHQCACHETGHNDGKENKRATMNNYLAAPAKIFNLGAAPKQPGPSLHMSRDGPRPRRDDWLCCARTSKLERVGRSAERLCRRLAFPNWPPAFIGVCCSCRSWCSGSCCRSSPCHTGIRRCSRATAPAKSQQP